MTTISDGVRAGTVVKCDNSDEKIQNVAKNVANYIGLEEAGHFKYGVCYILAQVGGSLSKLRLLGLQIELGRMIQMLIWICRLIYS